jgi:hypothetical protein
MSFHPSRFETQQYDTPHDKRILMTNEIQTNDIVKNLPKGNKYGLTIDDDKLSKSNTNYLFRNLYGETLLTFMFFSEKNINNVQNVIRMLVAKETGLVVDKQSVTELLIVMRSIFLEYSAHPPLIVSTMSDQQKRALHAQYTTEVSRLNTIVINTIVPKVVSQMIQYINYLKDVSEPPQYMERPMNDNIKGEREYRSITDVLTGSGL